MNTDLIWQKFINEGDNLSFSLVYNTYVEILYAYGIHLGFRDELCKDAIQDVFYNIYVKKSESRKVKNPTAYLFKSYKYRLIDLARKEAKIENIDSCSDSFTLNITILDNMIDKEESILLKNKVEKLLECLSGQQREALYMRYMLGLGYDEIGEILQINSDSVRKIIYRSIKKIRQNIDNNHPEWLPLFLVLFFSF
ncbi:Sigma-70, region 4 [anaerobic digester metagenome]|jgi:RNA polymerase sigma factor (sigma-70 family)